VVGGGVVGRVAAGHDEDVVGVAVLPAGGGPCCWPGCCSGGAAAAPPPVVVPDDQLEELELWLGGAAPGQVGELGASEGRGLRAAKSLDATAAEARLPIDLDRENLEGQATAVVVVEANKPDERLKRSIHSDRLFYH
jgi:hypothetical protein